MSFVHRRLGSKLGVACTVALLGIAAASITLPLESSRADTGSRRGSRSSALPTHSELRELLRTVVGADINGGAGLDLWAVIVDRDAVVRTVVFSGEDRSAQLPIGRIVTTLKASTANNLSLDTFVVSTPQLTQPMQANGVFQNLQDAYPINQIAFRGPPQLFGTSRDPLVGRIVGGATALGGGLALYDSDGKIVGALGIGGEVHPCADHNAAWILRDRLGLDHLPAGIGLSETGDDNIVHDLDENGVSASGFGLRECSPQATAISRDLPLNFPLGDG